LGNIPRHVRSPGDYFQKPKEGSQLGATQKNLITLSLNILQNLKELAQTMQIGMHI
jgi:hypothetical protein